MGPSGARLLWADYRARHAHREERIVRAALLAAPRLLADPAMHAVVLLRIVGAAPPPLRGAAQRCLLWAHGMHVDPSARIGPGVRIPHPIAIALGPGVTIAGDVTLYQGVTVKSGGAPRGTPRIGAGARLYTGAVVCGPIEVGARAMVGAGMVVTADVPAGGRCVRRHGAMNGGGPIVALEPPLGSAGQQQVGVRALLFADHRARFGAAARPSLRRLLRDVARDRSLRVTAMVRVMQAGPRPFVRLWRRALLLHGCDVGFDASIGAGLSVPCPIGVCIGRRAVIGPAVELLEHTSVGPTRTSWHETTASSDGFSLGRGVRLLPGAGAFGSIDVGPGVVVGPRALVTRDVADSLSHAAAGALRDDDGGAGARAAPAIIRGDSGDAERAPAARFTALLRSDLDRIAGRGADARLRAALGLPFQAAALMRAATSRRARLASIGRFALRNLHHCYVDDDVRIGPGLLLPLPCGIRLERGVRLGAGVTVYDRVSLRSDRALRGSGAAPIVADAAVVGTGAVVLGRVVVHGEVPDGAVLIGAEPRAARPPAG